MAPRPTGRSSGRRRPTPTSAEEFALSGPSRLPDPDFNAYRKDLADIALAGRVIASHYAEPLRRTIATDTVLRVAPLSEGQVLETVAAGEPFLMLDESLGWAWGYGGPNRRVGYLRSEALAVQ